jgi:monoamine oxidase
MFILAKPVVGRLFFAGEATSREHAATVHGAYLSGLRAAAEALASEYGKGPRRFIFRASNPSESH